MFSKNRNKIKLNHILLAVLPGLIVAGFWGFANSNPKTIFDESRLPGSKIVIDANDNNKRTTIAAEPLWQCGATLIDSRDSQAYATVQIGTQCWMAENLNVGTRIDGANEQDNDSVIQKYCYDNSDARCDTDGGLYQWAEVMALSYSCNTNDCSVQIQTPHQGICPSGWHVLTDGEWTILTNYLSANNQYWCDSNSTYIAKSLASTDDVQPNWSNSGTACHIGNDRSTNNLTGFTFLPAGNRSMIDKSFTNRTDVGLIWSASQRIDTESWYHFLRNNHATALVGSYNRKSAHSVRCLKD